VAATSRGTCYDWCRHEGCSPGDSCVNGSCIDRDVGARCASGIWCGLDRECSSVDFRCYPLYCDDGCGPGARCSYGSTCQSDSLSGTEYGLCFDGASCSSTADCTDGGECSSGTCSFWTTCATSADCDSTEYVCSEGRCQPYFYAPCTADAQCDRAHLTCDEGLGSCVYR
jgi:hypothetical protein